MTKRDMILEIIKGINYTNRKQVLENRCKNTKTKIEEVYNHYLKSNKTLQDKIFCSNLLVVL